MFLTHFRQETGRTVTESCFIVHQHRLVQLLVSQAHNTTENAQQQSVVDLYDTPDDTFHIIWQIFALVSGKMERSSPLFIYRCNQHCSDTKLELLFECFVA